MKYSQDELDSIMTMTRILSDGSVQNKHSVPAFDRQQILLLQWMLDDLINSHNQDPHSADTAHYYAVSYEIMSKLITQQEVKHYDKGI